MNAQRKHVRRVLGGSTHKQRMLTDWKRGGDTQSQVEARRRYALIGPYDTDGATQRYRARNWYTHTRTLRYRRRGAVAASTEHARRRRAGLGGRTHNAVSGRGLELEARRRHVHTSESRLQSVRRHTLEARRRYAHIGIALAERADTD